MAKRKPAAPARAKPRTMKRETAYAFAIRRLRDAREWSGNAVDVLAEQRDRIDTLDSIELAQRALTEAANAIRATLP